MPPDPPQPGAEDLLLVVDMLNGFLDPEGALYCGDEARKIIPFIAQRIEAFDGAGGVVVFSCDAHEETDPEFDIYDPHCVAGTWEAEIIPELPRPEGAEIVPKGTLNPFYKTALDRVVGQAKPRHVEVVGVCTNICVLYAVMEFTVRSYNVRVPRAGVATFDTDAHDYALGQMADVFGTDVV